MWHHIIDTISKGGETSFEVAGIALACLFVGFAVIAYLMRKKRRR